jgi:hypothetical protein
MVFILDNPHHPVRDLEHILAVILITFLAHAVKPAPGISIFSAETR